MKHNEKDVIPIMNKKSIATLLLLAFGVSGLGAAPALADDTAPVADTAQVTSAVQGATSNYHIDSYQLATSVINDEGTLYLPLRSTLEQMGAAVTTNPDEQARKIKLSIAGGDMQLYYNDDQTAIATSANGTYYPLKVEGDITYAPMAFIQQLTNRVVSVQGSILMLIQTDESAFWKSLETYSVDDAYVTKSVGDQIVATAMKYLGARGSRLLGLQRVPCWHLYWQRPVHPRTGARPERLHPELRRVSIHERWQNRWLTRARHAPFVTSDMEVCNFCYFF